MSSHTGDDLRQFGGASLDAIWRRQQEDYIDIVDDCMGAAFVFRGEGARVKRAWQGALCTDFRSPGLNNPGLGNRRV